MSSVLIFALSVGAGYAALNYWPYVNPPPLYVCLFVMLVGCVVALMATSRKKADFDEN
jgi:hypothetical protein